MTDVTEDSDSFIPGTGIPSDGPRWKSWFQPTTGALLVAMGHIGRSGARLRLFARHLSEARYRELVAPSGYSFYNLPVVSSAHSSAYVLLAAAGTDRHQLARLVLPDGTFDLLPGPNLRPEWVQTFVSDLYCAGPLENEVYACVATQAPFVEGMTSWPTTYNVARIDTLTGDVSIVSPLLNAFY